MEKGYGRVKFSCYMTNITMAVVGNLSPILFLTFRSMYGISYALLGTLVLINFCTQLGVDLIFSFFSHKFNIPLTVKCTPVIAVFGMIFFALSPIIFPNAVYLWLVIGTVIFAASSGLAEVLISPVIAALPSDNPDREMSKLHAVYAWGAVGVVVLATLFLLLIGGKNWQWLAGGFAIVPLIASIAFSRAEVPQMQTPEKTSGALGFFKNGGLWLCVFAIFLGGASEVTMAQWSSSYLEKALDIPKVWGDICGVALFGLALAMGRTLYAKFGKNIGKILSWGAVGAAVCYLVAVFVPVPVVGLLACGLTGFCVSMMWPGSLVMASDRFPQGGVVVYAMMAAGGDLGASVAPQLVGVVTDSVSHSSFFIEMAAGMGLTGEQLGMRAGLLIGAVFPLVAIIVFFAIRRLRAKKQIWTGQVLVENTIKDVKYD